MTHHKPFVNLHSRLKALLATTFVLSLLVTGAAWAQDTLVIGTGNLPRTLDAPRESSNVGAQVLPSVFDTLITMDTVDQSNLLPSLAVSWERVGDTTLELKLREGVIFHNGDPFTAEDVKFTIDRVIDPESEYASARTILATITSVEVIDDYTVRIHSDGPDAMLEYRIAGSGAWILPKGYTEEVGATEFGQNPVGTGAFTVASFTPDRIVLERFDSYWGEMPQVKTIEFRNIPEVSSRITALVNGEVQIIAQVPPDQIPVIERFDGVRTLSVLLNNMHVLIANTFNPPMDDPLLRQALSLGIDRQLLVDALWSGAAAIPQGHQFNNIGDMFDDSRPEVPYDPERARELVAASSYTGETLIYNTQENYYTNEVAAAEAIVDMWQDIGVNARVRIVDRSDRLLPDRHLLPWSNSGLFPDPAGGLTRNWGPASQRQTDEWHPANPAFNEAAETLLASLDPEVRAEAAKTAIDIFEEEAPGIILYMVPDTVGISNDWNWVLTSDQLFRFGPSYLEYVGD